MSKQSKGGAYEREICGELSRWWTGGLRDDIFYRSSNSGGRATARRRSGKSTYNQVGDVACTDPCGSAFTDLFNVELKRGYSDASVHDVFDYPAKSVEGWYEQWMLKAAEECRLSGTFGWLLIARRDRRESLIWMDMSTTDALADVGAKFYLPPMGEMLLKIRCNDRQKFVTLHVFGTRFSHFLDTVTREMIEKLRDIS